MRIVCLSFLMLLAFFFCGDVFAENKCHVSGDGASAKLKAENDSNLPKGEKRCKCVSYEIKKTVEGKIKKSIRWADKNGFDYTYCVELQEAVAGKETVVGRTGIDLISRYISLIYKYGASIIGVFCVLIIVVSGVQISMGGANSENVNQGKERILQALLSLILLFCSALILKVVNPGFFI